MPDISRAAVAAALDFGKAPRRHGQKPTAAPFQRINDLATRTEDSYLYPERDGPRTLNEGKTPYWMQFPDEFAHPIEEAARPGRISKELAFLGQLAVDATVGICAVVAVIFAAALFQREKAETLLCAHAFHLATSTFVVGSLAMIVFLG